MLVKFQSSLYLCSNSRKELMDTAEILLLLKILWDLLSKEFLLCFWNQPENWIFSWPWEVEMELHHRYAHINSSLSTSGTLPSLLVSRVEQWSSVSLITSKLYQQVEEGEKDKETANLFFQAAISTFFLLPSLLSCPLSLKHYLAILSFIQHTFSKH